MKEPMKKLDPSDEHLLENVLEMAREAEANDEMPFLLKAREIDDEMGAGAEVRVYFILTGDMIELHTHSVTTTADALTLGQKLAIMTLGLTGGLDNPENDPPDIPPAPIVA